MTQTAVVTQLIGDKARIEVTRMSACAHNCAECGGGCSEMMKSGPVSVLARNPLGAKPGDRVVVASSTSSILGAAALVYLLPLLLFFIGYFVAQGMGAGEGTCIAAGGICFVLALVVIVVVDRRVRQKNRELFSIVEICSD